MPNIETARGLVHYESPNPANESTPGARILFIHGPGVDHRLFSDQLRFFAGAHIPIALDLAGHGASGGRALEDVVEWGEFIREFVDTLHLAPVIICGHALGAAIALEYAYSHPHDVEGLVLVDMGVTFPSAADAAADLASDPAAYRQRNSQRGLAERASTLAIEALVAARNATSVESAIQDLVTAAKWDATPRLSAIHTPTLIVFGEEDPLLSQASNLLAGMQHASLDTIPLTRHFPHLEMPDMFNDTLNRFVTTIPDMTPVTGGE